jgi:putative FmdB family regulatory protein
MPIYTYKCKNCGKVTEKFKSMNSNGSEKCEHCSSETSMVFSPAGIIFKGSGFYTTDYKSSGSKPSAKSTKSETDEKETKKEVSKTTDSKSIKTDPEKSPSTSNTGSKN